MDRTRIQFSNYEPYLHGAWRTLLADLTVQVGDQILAKCDFAIVSVGRELTDILEIELLGLKPGYDSHRLVLPGGAILRRSIHLWDDFPRISGVDRNGDLVKAVASPTRWGGDFSRITVLSAELEELTISTASVCPNLAETGGTGSVWFRNLKDLSGYRQTRKFSQRRGSQEYTGFASDWMTLELADAAINFEKRDRGITDLEIVMNGPADVDSVSAMGTAVTKALSTLFMKRIQPLVSGVTFAEYQSVTLFKRKPDSAGGGRFVYTGGTEEVEWLTKGTQFFLSSPISRRVWDAVQLVLDARNQHRAVQVALAIESIAKVWWVKVHGKGGSGFQPSKRLQQILEFLGQTFVDEELQLWRWYRDGTVHSNDNFLDAPPADVIGSWAVLDRLFARLLVGVVGYKGHWFDSD
jgi:hypothetical protein